MITLSYDEVEKPAALPSCLSAPPPAPGKAEKQTGDPPGGYFTVRTNKDTFAKGSQVYITYGRHQNQELLLHYGFCLSLNKYNYLHFRAGLPQVRSKLESVYKKSVFAQMFDCHTSFFRRFRIYYQQFNACNIRPRKTRE